MTDKEITNALVCHADTDIKTCIFCSYNCVPMCGHQLSSDAADLIKRQQAEIERLETENNRFADIGKMYSEIKAEAIKEFANETIDWCRQKLTQEKKNPFGLTGKRLEGYEQAILSVMSYLHSKKE